MRLLPRILVFATLLLAACATPKTTAWDPAAEKEVLQRAELLLDRYSRNDQAGVVALLDAERFHLVGTGFGETIATPAELRALMERDFSQWGSASFKDIRDVDVRSDGRTGTVYLTFTFAAGGGPSLPIRFTSTWRKVNGEWLLAQAMSAVPPR
jgi:hypothetical protein